jgi:hypothetical protein
MAALVLGARQKVTPAGVVGAADLGIEEAVDGLGRDRFATLFAGQPADDLFRGTAVGETVQNQFAQFRMALQAGTAPVPGPGPIGGIDGPVSNRGPLVALHLARDRRWRATQSCSDLPFRLPGFMKPGNRTSLFQREVSISASHGNTTLRRCCTSFVNLEGSLYFQGKPMPRFFGRPRDLRMTAFVGGGLR